MATKLDIVTLISG